MVCFFRVGLITLGSVVFLFLLGYIWYKRSSKKLAEEFAKRGYKYVSLPNFFVMRARGQRLEVIQLEKIRQTGTIFGTSVFGKPAILVAEPDLIQNILSKEFTNFTDRREFKFVGDEISSSFLSIVPGEKWKRIRSVITPAFASGKLRQMQPRIDLALETLVRNIDDAIKEQTDADIKRLFGGFTMDTIIQVSYGIRVDSLNDSNPIIKYAKKAFQEITFKNILVFTCMLTMPKLAQKLRLRVNAEINDFFKDFSTKIINQRKKDLAELSAKDEPFKSSNFLDFMIEAENQMKQQNSEEEMKKKYISNIEMIAQCILFFLAGYETTASALTLSIYHLMTNPDIQERVYNEIQDVLSQLENENSENTEDTRKGLQLVNLDNLPRFELLGAVLDETLRIYAPANFLERTCLEDITIETEDKKHKLEVKKGEIVHIPIYPVHRDERFFPKPEKFDPDRFLGERNKEHHKYSYIPFGAGPRNCVARTFAIMEARMALLHCLFNFRFSVGSKTSIPPKFINQTGLISPKECFTSVKRRNH